MGHQLILGCDGHDGRELATYDYLARNFAVCDRYFASLPGPTWPNRLYSVAGTSAGEKDNPSPDFFARYSMPTIFDYVDQALPGVPTRNRWGYFHSGPFAFPLVFNQHLDDILPFHKRIRPLGDFFKLAAAGNLPAVSWVEPDYRGQTKNNDHPEGDIRFGQEFVARIYNAILSGDKNLWWESLLVVTYDEHGGFFDHVDPRSVPPPADEYLPYYGVRVPALVVSPWVKKGSCVRPSSTTASVLKTILNRFWPAPPVPAMTARVQAASDLAPLLSETRPRVDAVGIPFTPVARPADKGASFARDLATRHGAAVAGLTAVTDPKRLDVARRDRVRIPKSEYQVLAEAYSADLRQKQIPVPRDDAPEMGVASAASRKAFGLPRKARAPKSARKSPKAR